VLAPSGSVEAEEDSRDVARDHEETNDRRPTNCYSPGWPR